MVTENDIEKIFKKHSKGRIPRGRAIKLYCKELCCAGDIISWRECTFTQCFLWNFRLGREYQYKPSSVSKRVVIRKKYPKNVKSGGTSE